MCNVVNVSPESKLRLQLPEMVRTHACPAFDSLSRSVFCWVLSGVEGCAVVLECACKHIALLHHRLVLSWRASRRILGSLQIAILAGQL